MNYTKFDWQLASSLAREIRLEHRKYSPDETLVLWLTSNHIWVAIAKQASCLLHHTGCSACPFYTPTINRYYDYTLNTKLF